jgi:hypothetical protein
MLLAAVAILVMGVGMGVFLTWVSNTPRSGSKDEDQQTRKDSPESDPKKELTDSLADFGELLPEPVFPPPQKPETPQTPKTELPTIPKSETTPDTPKPPPPQKKPEADPLLPPRPGQAAVTSEPLRISWLLKAGDTFYQDLIITQKPTFRVQGLLMNSALQYNVVSRFVIEEAGPRGVIATQRVEGARLLAADGVTQGLVLPALAKLPGTTFRLQLGPDLSVQRFVGNGGKMMLGGGAMPGGLGLQTASLMDLDGWREMAQATFFQPAPALLPRTNWVRQMSHNWGPLGGWVGQTLYVYSGKQGPLHQFTYGHRMNYVAPRGGGGGMGLIQVAGAAFQPQEAVGSIVFDSSKGRVTSGQEKFRVVGRLTLVLLGMPSPVDIEEEQTFQYRILDALPSK